MLDVKNNLVEFLTTVEKFQEKMSLRAVDLTRARFPEEDILYPDEVACQSDGMVFSFHYKDGRYYQEYHETRLSLQQIRMTDDEWKAYIDSIKADIKKKEKEKLLKEQERRQAERRALLDKLKEEFGE